MMFFFNSKTFFHCSVAFYPKNGHTDIYAK